MTFVSFSQSDNVVYTNLHQPDSRIKVTMFHNRTVSLGSQDVGVQVINLTDKALKLKLEFFALMTCGQKIASKIGHGDGVILKPYDTLKAGGWFDTKNTSFDAANRRNSECLKSPNKAKQLPDGKYTTINDVGFDLISVSETTVKVTGTNSGAISNTSTASNGSSQVSTTSGSVSTSCPTYGFKIANKPGPRCVALQWWALNTKTFMMSSDGTFSESKGPQPKSFIIEYKKQSELFWTSVPQPNGGNNLVTLTHLDPCTTYEVKLTTVCDNNAISAPTKSLKFTTYCSPPARVNVEQVTSSSARINIGPQTPTAIYPCESDNSRLFVVEYKSATTNWEETQCPWGSPCKITLLAPNTDYKVRTRFKYAENLYSKYTSEMIFKTKP